MKKNSRRQGIDFFLFLPIICLLATGVLMVFSASSVSAYNQYHNAYYFLQRQAIWVALGSVIMMIAAGVDYYKLKQYSIYLYIFGLLCLLAVLVLGKTVNGAKSWIELGPANLQPSELIKPLVVLELARILSSKQKKIHSLTEGVGPALVSLAIVCALIMAQPDLGTTMVLLITAFTMFFVARVSYLHLGMMAGSGSALGVFFLLAKSYRKDRIATFMDPWKDPLGTGYQIVQSLYAIGSGGLWGLGLGQSKQKYLWLPEEHNDFIFAIIGEELGFVGGVFILGLYALLTSRGLLASRRAPDDFGRLLAAGLTAMIAVEAIINLAVVTGSMPVTGVTLPFISYGGSSLLFKMAGMGILLNISRHSVQEQPVQSGEAI
ncbi:MAG TPA: putative lipid II flippase FtsW [Bacillota bacterium]|nr:putative lipid II flippase FtsW [Bacillota bacterium]